MTALGDHTHELVVQGNQAARSRALGHLLEDHDLPTVSCWAIDSNAVRLAGLIHAERDDTDGAEQRRKIQAWADYLDSEVVETRTRSRIEMAVEGRAYGVPVRIWAPRANTTKTPKAA
jgi:hypothetical protein